MDVVAEAYSRRADEYIAILGSMAAVHPADRELVDRWATSLLGRVLDAGCGPGHWTNHLAGLGCDIRGLDAAATFVEHARASYPELRFDVGSIDAIEATDGSLGGLLSWFSTIHHHPDRIVEPIAEFARVLRPGGGLALGFFVGKALESFDHAVTTAYRWPVPEMQRLLTANGFDVVETSSRAERGERTVGAIVCRRRDVNGFEDQNR
ncbi:class I SAM-dependent methyltransferase [Microbacteriaceae bacterium VKM Ac-2855]|nr:class I SAM-dependent methyltransferase [Microbacteriaceae bacterium VKM Ac-2855]